MKASSILLALLSVVSAYSGSPYSSDSASVNPLASVESLLSAASQLQGNLNNLLDKAVSDKHLSPEFLTSYIIGTDYEINEVVNNLQSVVTGYSPDVAKAIVGSIIKPYYDTVTKGAHSVLENAKSSGITIDARTAAGLTVSLQRLSDLASFSTLDNSDLQSLSQQCNSLSNGNVKRASNSDMSGVVGSVNNFQETINTFLHEVSHDKGHGAAAAVTALITGLDGQVDNLAATIFNVANKLTFGLTSPIGDFLLGPIFQGMTNGAEVLISNIIGGGIDMVADAPAQLFTGTMSKLIDMGKKINVSVANVAMLEDAKKQWVSLNANLNKNTTAPAESK